VVVEDGEEQQRESTVRAAGHGHYRQRTKHREALQRTRPPRPDGDEEPGGRPKEVEYVGGNGEVVEDEGRSVDGVCDQIALGRHHGDGREDGKDIDGIGVGEGENSNDLKDPLGYRFNERFCEETGV
jgi:hypothetical protein